MPGGPELAKEGEEELAPDGVVRWQLLQDDRNVRSHVDRGEGGSRIWWSRLGDGGQDLALLYTFGCFLFYVELWKMSSFSFQVLLPLYMHKKKTRTTGIISPCLWSAVPVLRHTVLKHLSSACRCSRMHASVVPYWPLRGLCCVGQSASRG